MPLALADAIAAEWLDGGALAAPAWLADWAEAASERHASRYRDLAWTWRR
jgi:hypothetical protein